MPVNNRTAASRCLRSVAVTVVWTLVTIPSPGAGQQTALADNKTSRVRSCRDSWVRNLTSDEFNALTCSKCLVQMFMGTIHLEFADRGWPPAYPYALVDRTTNRTHLADPDTYPSAVCEATRLSKENCTKWRSCCYAARNCCQEMGAQQAEGRCPATWDGMVCWPSTPPNTTPFKSCPYYYMEPSIAWQHPHARRTCMANGSWIPHPVHRYIEYTDYTSCHDLSYNKYILRVSLYIDVVGNAVSVCSLIISIIIIVGFRSLRRDLLGKDSLKLHINLFVAMILAGIFSLSFHYITFNKSIVDQNPVWCRCLNVITAYFRSVTYIAMLAEGLYLHRRISRVLYLSRREPLLKYFIMSWTIPAVSVLAYIITRVGLGLQKDCWMHRAVQWPELIHMVPNVISLACNIIFLISIEVNLWTKMRTDSSDRRVDVLRHALRATLSLIPVFGLQFVFLAYRPVNWPPYEIMSAAVRSTQGFLVAVLYCLSTKEVRNELLLFCKRWCVCPCAGYRRSCFSGARRLGKDSPLADRCLDTQGYMYMCQRTARNSLSVPGGGGGAGGGGRRSLPDVIDSVCISKACTRTTSLGNHLQEREYRLSLHTNRVSTDVSPVTTDPQTAGPSTNSLPQQCACNAKQVVECTCTNEVATRSSLAPLLGESCDQNGNGCLSSQGEALPEVPNTHAPSVQPETDEVTL